MPDLSTQAFQDAILAVTLALGGLVTLLIFCLLVLKNIRFWRRGREQSLHRWMKPLLEEFIRHSDASIPRRFTRARGYSRQVLKYLVIYRSFGVKPGILERLSFLYARLGFAREDTARLNSIFWWKRAESARCLGQMRFKEALEPLLSKLKDPVLEVRLLASWSLGRLGNPSVVRPVLENLANSSKLAGMRLSSTVFELGEKAVVPLMDLSSHEDSSVRLLVVHLLAELKDTRAYPVLTDKCDPKENKEVRIAAYKALGTLRDLRAVPLLRKGTLQEESWEARAQAAKSLGKMEAAEAAPELTQALGDSNWWVRRNAGEALSLLGKTGAAALRKAESSHKDRFARDMARQWLDELV